MHADLIISNIGQLVTCASAGRPKRGAEMRDVGLIYDAAIAIADGKVAAIVTQTQIVLPARGSESGPAGAGRD